MKKTSPNKSTDLTASTDNQLNPQKGTKMPKVPKKNVVVINFAGSIGKTTITKQLLAPMMGECTRIQIESINSASSGADIEIDATQFTSLAERIALRKENLLIDIGGSNVESVLKQMAAMQGFQGDVDFWVVPVDERSKVMTNTINTVSHLLNDLDIEPEKIVVIANNIEFPKLFHKKFAPIFTAAKSGGFNFSDYSIMKSDLFDLVKDDDRSIIEIANETTDFNALIVGEEDDAKLALLGRAAVHRVMAKSLEKNLRAVWASTPLSA